jgi:outer membrane protein assembly factor BamA
MFYRDFTKNFRIGIGPQYQYIEIDKTEGRFITQTEAKVAPSVFSAANYLALKLYSRISTLDNVLYPGKGIIWNLEAGGYQRIGHATRFIRLASDFAVFYTPKSVSIFTFATRVGGATNLGDFEFFQANTLGGTTNLRGYRRTRYYGRSSYFHNTELRVKLFDANFYLFPAKVGLLGFYDYGRVWSDGERSNLWHTGFGPGLWIQVYNKAALTATYGFTPDAGFLNLQLGFLF